MSFFKEWTIDKELAASKPGCLGMRCERDGARVLREARSCGVLGWVVWDIDLFKGTNKQTKTTCLIECIVYIYID